MTLTAVGANLSHCQIWFMLSDIRPKYTGWDVRNRAMVNLPTAASH